jgi:Ca-activated chloride channel family protein
LHNARAEVVVNVAAAVFAAAALAAMPAVAQDIPQAGQPQQPAQQAHTPTFRSGSSLVALNVTVQDRGSKFVQGLQPADFVVYEDGVKQNVEFFDVSHVPVDLIVLLDTSTSMRDAMPIVQDAASGFMKTLRPGDRGAVVSFANTVSVLQPLTDDQTRLQQAIRGTRANGNTCLNNAVYIALKEFGRAAQGDGEVRRQAIVLLSDGADTASLISFDTVIDQARRMGVAIYTVSLQQPMSNQHLPRRVSEDADYTMKTLARETGAQAFSPLPQQLHGVYTSIATELANQYSIGYVPANSATDGRFRHVNVQVIKPQLFSRTRLGYIAAAVNALPGVRALGGDVR